MRNPSSFSVFALGLFVATQLDAGPLFSEISAQIGVQFQHDNGATGELLFPEITGPGAALLDIDNDGDLDLYLMQGGIINKPDATRQDKLYRNMLSESGSLKFEDITQPSGIDARGYGMAVAAGDFDENGFVDVLVLNYDSIELWRNLDGKFSRHQTPKDSEKNAWNTGATFADINGDGWLDIYITRYVHYDPQDPPVCYANSSRKDYCGPGAFSGQADLIWVQNSDTHAFETAPLQQKASPGLGVVARDFNADGTVDFYVANDGAANFLWLNDNGKLKDDAWFAGVAVNQSGQAEASMGISAADFDADGDQDIFLTHLMDESSTLYRNNGKGQFKDISANAGLGMHSRNYTGWGTAFLFANQDRFMDLVSIHGAVRIIEEQLQAGERYPLKQDDHIFLGSESGKLTPVDKLTAGFGDRYSGRGAAFGDLDNDGDTDFVVMNSQGPAQVFRNNLNPESWTGIEVREKNRHAIGATVMIEGRQFIISRDGSYASSNDPRIAIPWQVKSIEVTFLDGTKQDFDIAPGQYNRISHEN